MKPLIRKLLSGNKIFILDAKSTTSELNTSNYAIINLKYKSFHINKNFLIWDI